MKATIERATLLKGLGHVHSVVERRNTIPILSNVLIEAEEGDAGGGGAGLRLMATDLDLQINERVEANVTEPGATTVPAHTLFDIVRKLPEGSQVELIAAEGRMQVNAGRARFTLSTLPRDDFPVIAEGDLPTAFELPAATLAPDHRQDPLRHLDRRDALLSERHLPARLRRGPAGAEGGRDRRPPAGAGDGGAARGRAGHAGRDHPAQMRGRIAQAARRGRRHRPGEPSANRRSASGSAMRC